jgi:Na+-driven multidrug efflux pump
VVIKAAYTYLGITLITYPLIAVLLVANGVLRGVGDMETPMKLTVAMNIINVLFGYILIFGVDLDLGFYRISFQGLQVIGTVLGIAIARTFGSIVILFCLSEVPR